MAVMSRFLLHSRPWYGYTAAARTYKTNTRYQSTRKERYPIRNRNHFGFPLFSFLSVICRVTSCPGTSALILVVRSLTILGKRIISISPCLCVVRMTGIMSISALLRNSLPNGTNRSWVRINLGVLHRYPLHNKITRKRN